MAEVGSAHAEATSARKLSTGSLTTVRLPSDLRDELATRTGPDGSASDIVRAALVEYFENHPKAG